MVFNLVQKMTWTPSKTKMRNGGRDSCGRIQALNWVKAVFKFLLQWQQSFIPLLDESIHMLMLYMCLPCCDTSCAEHQWIRPMWKTWEKHQQRNLENKSSSPSSPITQYLSVSQIPKACKYLAYSMSVGKSLPSCMHAYQHTLACFDTEENTWFFSVWFSETGVEVVWGEWRRKKH